MGTVVVFEVSQSDAEELREFAATLENALLVESRALDGDAAIQLVATVVLATIPVIRAWLLARSDRKKSTLISWNGNKIQGYDAAEVKEIIESLSALEIGESNDE